MAGKDQLDASRRGLLQYLGAWGLGAVGLAAVPRTSWGSPSSQEMDLPFKNGHRELVAFPQKRPLILLSNRPPQLETPFSVFRESVFTPNDAFFVRYHWSEVPTTVNLQTYRLRVSGKVDKPLELSLAEIKQLADPVEIAAVNQCSGNSRGLMKPRVNGGQLSNGAMGNARWTGVSIKKVLEAAGLQAGALQVTFDGLDHPPLKNSPDFVKALDVDHAMDGEVMLAWAMNGEDLPMLNGYPLRLVVPGYYGTYWMKHVSAIEVLDKPFDGFWMSHAYRVPDDACRCVAPGVTPTATRPISRFDVRSFITSLMDGEHVRVGHAQRVRGIAFDGGEGITEVAFSADGGRVWQEAQLGKDYGRYSFREWTAAFKPVRPGPYALMVRAVNRIGQSQPMENLWNPGGYMRNAVETTHVVAVQEGA
ncbi:MAG: molybdopterin-dependent oxidoreductase [Ferrovum sp.]|nr:molybdopterin-dependent oxidoreductase [Ferrovum sp.]